MSLAIDKPLTAWTCRTNCINLDFVNQKTGIITFCCVQTYVLSLLLYCCIRNVFDWSVHRELCYIPAYASLHGKSIYIYSNLVQSKLMLAKLKNKILSWFKLFSVKLGLFLASHCRQVVGASCFCPVSFHWFLSFCFCNIIIRSEQSLRYMK